jgi:argininosuccinate synthase
MKAVLAYSGGLDTSCAIAWLKEDYGFDEVVAVLVDVGQEADFEPAIQRGYAAGADDVILLDRKDLFAEEVVAKALLANALYEGKYPLISSLSRPIIGQAIGEIARELGADAIVHGCTGKGNDQVRLELAFKATYPGVHVIAPLRDTPWTRDAEIAYAAERGIPIEAKPESPFSIDDNLFGRAIEAGVLEDPWAAPPEEAFVLTVAPAAAAEPVEVVIGFEQAHGWITIPEAQCLDLVLPFHMRHSEFEDGAGPACAHGGRYPSAAHLGAVEWGSERQRPLVLQLADGVRQMFEPGAALRRSAARGGKPLRDDQRHVSRPPLDCSNWG